MEEGRIASTDGKGNPQYYASIPHFCKAKFDLIDWQEERTGRYGTPRLQYLQELVTQFQNSTNEETKERLVANLANFAYDLYSGLAPAKNTCCRLNVLEFFEDCITEPNEKLVEFGIGGVCNSCAGRNYALRALYYLCNKYNRKEILKPAAEEAVSVSFNIANDPCENDHDFIGHSPKCDSVAVGHPNPDSPQRPSSEKTTSSGCRRPQEQTTCILNRDFVTILASCEVIFIMGVDL
ncbi:hypothetical protein TIFTF001_034500 [Ficus carica]|uniref:Uncharacterized protein n=1 Tax=Ficus carica TaxID=3494 RepID=A0AA88J966_FICCA|nr:hypothetical protein TIFTF001_034500 [Ficus carica]